MRITKMLILPILLFLCITLNAQDMPVLPLTTAPLQLEVSTGQTSVIIFPAAIKSVDRGNGNIITKTVHEIGNVLKVKATTDSMKTTNLHVFTADGNIFSFEVHYRENPAQLTFDLTKQKQSYLVPARFSSERLNESQISSYAEILSHFKPVCHRPSSKWKGRTRIEATGTYYIDGVLFFQFRLLNASSIPYEIDFTRSYIRDRKRSKRTSITEKEIIPLHHYNTRQEIPPCRLSVMLLAFNRFTIADNKHFVVEVFEKNGDRYLSCKLKGKDILKALHPTLSEFQMRRQTQP
ncbi:MAG: conjugative transposon protein TraN [Chitinophagaceae bacterium]|nr:conjugative transposon protein TraN [Chitinophagaceae bacterium]